VSFYLAIAEIYDFRRVIVEHDVCGFQISMNNFSSHQTSVAFENSLDDVESFLFSKFSSFLNVLLQSTPVAILSDHIAFRRILNDFDSSQNVLMV
jgi:hypothetical protein